MCAAVDPMAPTPGAERPADYRYGAVFACTAVVLVFLVVAPSADWSRAVALALQCLALIVTVATSRARRPERRARAAAVGAVAAVLVLGVGVGLVPAYAATVLSAFPGLAASLALVGGLLALVRRHGVTLQAVAGALAIYLQIGLIFAWIVGFAAHVGTGPYFEQGGDGTQSDHVYFSFTVLTTTGFGDLTAAEPAGRAVAVVEMLGGQLYLVTVIGVLVGGLAGRRSP
jgi:Ion channel